MSEREMRSILHEVMEDIEQGRLSPPRPSQRRLRLVRVVGPPLMAASLGLTGCMSTGIGTQDDGGVDGGGAAATDARTSDAGAVPPYMGPFDATVDGGPTLEYMAPFDATVDGGPTLEYMAPFDAGPEPDYMAPFDGSVEEEDAGFTPLYMGPPPVK
jgi:hypothetical protein